MIQRWYWLAAGAILAVVVLALLLRGFGAFGGTENPGPRVAERTYVLVAIEPVEREVLEQAAVALRERLLAARLYTGTIEVDDDSITVTFPTADVEVDGVPPLEEILTSSGDIRFYPLVARSDARTEPTAGNIVLADGEDGFLELGTSLLGSEQANFYGAAFSSALDRWMVVAQLSHTELAMWSAFVEDICQNYDRHFALALDTIVLDTPRLLVQQCDDPRDLVGYFGDYEEIPARTLAGRTTFSLLPTELELAETIDLVPDDE